MPCYFRLISDDGVIVSRESLGHIIILPAPPPPLIGETIDSPHLLRCHGGGSTKQSRIWELVTQRVHCRGEMSGLVRAGVEVAIILGYQINIVKHWRINCEYSEYK